MSNTNKELKALIDEFNQDFKISSEASRSEVLKSLRGGEKAPESGKIYGDSNREEFNSRAAEYRAKASELVQKEIDKVNDAMTEAPSDDAVRALTVVGMRDNVSREEFEALFNKYGDNYQSAKTIINLASKQKVFFDNVPLEQKLNDLERLGTSLRSSLTLKSAEDHADSPLYTALQVGTIDSILPEE